MPLAFAEPASRAYRFPLLIRHLLQSAVDTRSDAVIVGTDSGRRSYDELARRVGRLAQVLADCGVRPGDVVAVMDWDSHRYLEAYFAVPMMGAVLQTVNVRLSPDQIAYTLRGTGVRVLLFHADFTPLVEDLRGGLPAIAHRILLHDGAGDAGTVPIIGEYEELLAADATLHAFEDFDEDALATTFHTTGTTGLPKAVAFSHRQLVLHTLATMATLAAQPDDQSFRRSDVYMPITPMFHVHAWGMPYVATLLGAKQVYPGRYLPDRLVALRDAEGVTFSHGVPTIVQMLVAALGEGVATPPWKMVVGGSAFPRALRLAGAARGISAIAGYGMSETGPVLTVARGRPDDPDDDRRSHAGRATPLVQIRLDDGEVTVRAPWLTQGYRGDAAASEALWRDGWLHTQDVADIAADGTLVIRDRLKDVIKTGGEWVSSVQMEDLTLGHPAIAEAAFIGIADERWGERPLAFVVARGVAPTLDELRAHLDHHVRAGAISRYALPDGLVVLDALPRTSVGKIDKKALRRRVAAS